MHEFLDFELYVEQVCDNSMLGSRIYFRGDLGSGPSNKLEGAVKRPVRQREKLDQTK